jgi:hypothetical protein
MAASYGMSISMGSLEEEELLSLGSVQATGRKTRQSRGCLYQELGGNYFDHLHAERLKQHLVKRLEGLGLSVTLQPQAG